MKCEICNKDKTLIRHHTDYENEITVKICVSCHHKIHKGNKYPEFQAIKPEGYKYPTMKLPEGRKSALINIDEELYDEIKIKAIREKQNVGVVFDRLVRQGLKAD